MSSDTTCTRRVSIDESGLTTLDLAVTHDQPTPLTVTIEEPVPDAVPPKTLAATRDTGTWLVSTDRTVRWSVSVGPDQTATGTLGLEIVDPDAVEELADGTDTTVSVDETATGPHEDTDAVDGMKPRPLSDAACDGRIPEAVYERARTVDADTVTESVTGRVPMAAGAGNEPDRGQPPTHRNSPSTTTEEPDPGATATDPNGNTDRTTAARSGAPVDSEDGGADESVSVPGEGWHGDPLENAIRRTDETSRADETAYRFVLAFEPDDATTLAIEVLEGLLNGTTVFVAEPPLSALRKGANPTELTATISSAVCEESIVGALEAIDGAALEHFETLDPDVTDPGDLASDPSHRFELLSDVVDSEDYDEFAEDVAAIEDCAFDFGAEPVSYEDLVEDPVAAARDAADAETAVNDGGTTEPGGVESGKSPHRVIERLLEELDGGGVTERERVELRRRLGVDPRPSTEIRLDRVESRTAEFAAYSDALAAFLDEEGTAQTLLEDLRAEVTRLDDRTTDLETTVEEARRTAVMEREELADSVSDLDRAQRSTRTDLEELATTHAAEQERVDELDRAIGANTDDIEHLASDVRDSIASLEATAESLETDVTGLGKRLDALERYVEERLDDVETHVDERMDALEARVSQRMDALDASVDEQILTLEANVEARVDGIEESVEENSRVREQLESLAQ